MHFHDKEGHFPDGIERLHDEMRYFHDEMDTSMIKREVLQLKLATFRIKRGAVVVSGKKRARAPLDPLVPTPLMANEFD